MGRLSDSGFAKDRPATIDELHAAAAKMNEVRARFGYHGRWHVHSNREKCWLHDDGLQPASEAWEPSPEEIAHEHAVVQLYMQELADCEDPLAEFLKLAERGEVSRRSDEIRRTQGLLRSNHKLPEPA